LRTGIEFLQCLFGLWRVGHKLLADKKSLACFINSPQGLIKAPEIVVTQKLLGMLLDHPLIQRFGRVVIALLHLHNGQICDQGWVIGVGKKRLLKQCFGIRELTCPEVGLAEGKRNVGPLQLAGFEILQQTDHQAVIRDPEG